MFSDAKVLVMGVGSDLNKRHIFDTIYLNMIFWTWVTQGCYF